MDGSYIFTQLADMFILAGFSNLFLVCPLKHAAVLMDLNGSHKIIPLDDVSPG